MIQLKDYHRVSAPELKKADMVKLPLRVITRSPGQRDQLLAEAISLRENLEAMAGQEAQAGGGYLRPILLIQAERVDDCEPLRDRLVADFGLAKDDIKISTGKLDELKTAKNISTTAWMPGISVSRGLCGRRAVPADVCSPCPPTWTGAS